MSNELYTFAKPVQVVPFSNLKWGKFTLLHTILTISPQFSTGKNQTTIGKQSHRILVTIPYFTGNYHS